MLLRQKGVGTFKKGQSKGKDEGKGDMREQSKGADCGGGIRALRVNLPRLGQVVRTVILVHTSRKVTQGSWR